MLKPPEPPSDPIEPRNVKPAGEWRVVEASFVTSAPGLIQCPLPELPEIAIAGRSNVGKSSLINTLCQRRNLAKTSSTPGKTRLINYFHLRIEPGAIRFHLVDLPGYGYSKVDKSTREQWGKSLAVFLEKRALRGILQLVDARHEPTALDLQMREWITFRRLPAITIVTKCDKLTQSETAKVRQRITERLRLRDGEPCILTSSVSRKGMKELLQALVDWTGEPRN